jgi:Methane oxygenase PmoA
MRTSEFRRLQFAWAVPALTAAAAAFGLAGWPVTAAVGSKPPHEVTVTVQEKAKRVDITVAGRPFTSYLWDEPLKKPVLYPLRSANGTLVTRGWPLDPRPGERVDHPHHVGLWLNYGNVNGLDFWNNSDTVKPENRAKMGTIVHRRIVDTRSGTGSGELIAEMDWTDARGAVLLHERAAFTFRGDAVARSVERITTLTAAGQRIVFTDNKEGFFGLRVARQLEHPSTTPEVFTDSRGTATTTPVMDNAGVTGTYVSSEGLKGDAVWGTRGRWTMLSGRIAERPVTLAILDHPANPGYPTYWHARGYGLFAANPLGHASLTEGKQPPFTLTLEPNTSVTFRYRLLIIDGAADSGDMEREARAFAGDQTSAR